MSTALPCRLVVPGAAVLMAASPAWSQTVSSFDELALRVNVGDVLRVEDRDGVRSAGRLTQLTDSEFTIQTATEAKRLTRETIRRAAVRRHPLRGGTLIGASASAAYGALAACPGADRTECPGAWIIESAIGAGAGLVVGHVIHRTHVLYPR